MQEKKKPIAERRKTLREFLQKREKLIIPGAYDALSARIIKGLGFETLYLGGYTTGAHLTTTEPLMTLTEQIDVASRIVRAVDLPLIVDGNAGFGDGFRFPAVSQEGLARANSSTFFAWDGDKGRKEKIHETDSGSEKCVKEQTVHDGHQRL